MSKLIRAYIDTADQTWKKVRAKNGRIMHFKDGTPVDIYKFNGGQANVKHEGLKPKVAVPSKKGPGYERIEVSDEEASQLGQELGYSQENSDSIPKDKVMLDGEIYDTHELVELNERIAERWQSDDMVMRY